MKFRERLARMVAGEPPPKIQLPAENPVDNDISRAARANAALSINDDDVNAYLVLLVRRSDGVAGVQLFADGLPVFWPAVAQTLERILMAGEAHERATR
jgi:hypothetical protein